MALIDMKMCPNFSGKNEEEKKRMYILWCQRQCKLMGTL